MGGVPLECAVRLRHPKGRGLQQMTAEQNYPSACSPCYRRHLLAIQSLVELRRIDPPRAVPEDSADSAEAKVMWLHDEVLRWGHDCEPTMVT